MQHVTFVFYHYIDWDEYLYDKKVLKWQEKMNIFVKVEVRLAKSGWTDRVVVNLIPQIGYGHRKYLHHQSVNSI